MTIHVPKLNLLVLRARGAADCPHEILLVEVGLDERLPKPVGIRGPLGRVKLGKLLRCR